MAVTFLVASAMVSLSIPINHLPAADSGAVESLSLPPADFRIPDSALAGASDFEQELLADGQVTFVEYERATNEMVRCLTEKGVPASEPRPALAPGFLTYGVFEPAVTEAADLVSSAREACERRFGSVVFAVYFAQHIPTGAQLQKEKQALIDCANEAGLAIEKSESVDMLRHIFVEVIDMTESQLDCFAKYEPVLHAIEGNKGPLQDASK